MTTTIDLEADILPIQWQELMADVYVRVYRNACTEPVNVPFGLACQAVRIGDQWGQQEAEFQLDQRPGKAFLPWTMGTYCGEYPDDGDNGEDRRDALEHLIDRAAKRAYQGAEARAIGDLE